MSIVQNWPGQPTSFNGWAIVAIVGAFVLPLVGIIAGHVSLGEIKRTGQRGRGLALSATILSYVMLLAYALAAVALVVFLIVQGAALGVTAVAPFL